MGTPIRLIVGLGNPGEEYAKTRHNAGAWFVEQLAADFGVQLRKDPKFHGAVASVSLGTQSIVLLLPLTFMNLSGQAVRAVSQFYQIPPDAILVAHDELDFAAGVVRLKKAGGHGGHNGLRNIIKHLHTNDFLRLRLGIGHPGDRSKVLEYVLGRPSKQDQSSITDAISAAMLILPALLNGEIDAAMLALHSQIYR